MKAQLWVEAHTPVPLVPLSMLKVEPGDVVYIGEAVYLRWHKDDPACPVVPYMETGWFQAGPNGLFVSLSSADYFWDSGLDLDKTLARRLQPNESVLVRYTNR